MENDQRPDRATRGRGAVSNRAGRFEAAGRYAVDDGWDHADEDETPPALRTTVQPDASRTVISRNKSPDIGFDRSINPYRGCEHGCVYCFARPTHAYLGLSPGLDFETRLFAKHDAAALLAKELAHPAYTPALIALGVNTDAYQPVERRLQITRGILEVLARFRHPVGLITKSALVERDIDILAPMAAQGLVSVTVSVTSLDRDLARTLEPRASTPAKRLGAVRALAAAGIPTGVNVSPIIPALTDWELERILEAARAAGATRASTILLRLPLELKDLFEEWLATHAPDRAAHVLSLVRQAHGGRLYQSAFGTRMRGEGPYADLIRQRFDAACKRLGLTEDRFALRTDLFRVPGKAGPQLGLPL